MSGESWKKNLYMVASNDICSLDKVQDNPISNTITGLRRIM